MKKYFRSIEEATEALSLYSGLSHKEALQVIDTVGVTCLNGVTVSINLPFEESDLSVFIAITKALLGVTV
jgi:hypothetical protein